MINLLYNLKKLHKLKTRSKKPGLETIPENKVLNTPIYLKKNEINNTVFKIEHWPLPNKKT